MTFECEICESSEFESCVVMRGGKRTCRKCLIDHPAWDGYMYCQCMKWNKQDLQDRIEAGRMLRKCGACDSHIIMDRENFQQGKTINFDQVKQMVSSMIKLCISANSSKSEIGFEMPELSSGDYKVKMKFEITEKNYDEEDYDD